MAIKSINVGIFNQTFRCYNCGRNSVVLLSEKDVDLEEENESKSIQDSLTNVLDLDSNNLFTYCSKCGWTDI